MCYQALLIVRHRTERGKFGGPCTEGPHARPLIQVNNRGIPGGITGCWKWLQRHTTSSLGEPQRTVGSSPLRECRSHRALILHCSPSSRRLPARSSELSKDQLDELVEVETPLLAMGTPTVARNNQRKRNTLVQHPELLETAFQAISTVLLDIWSEIFPACPWHLSISIQAHGIRRSKNLGEETPLAIK